MSTVIDTGRIPAAVMRVARRVKDAGGEPELVGGVIGDLLMEREPKDWDLEVFKLGYDRLAEIFEDMNPKLVGKQFGILKINVDGIDVDINVPRRDNHVGVGHNDLLVDQCPNLPRAEAQKRRDLTMNAPSMNPFTGEVYDHHGGVPDIFSGLIRATNPELYVQDPLRGLRAMQLLARKGTAVDPATMTLIRGMVDSFPNLAKERIWVEFSKLFMKAEKPSVGLEFLRESGWIKHFPELEAMIGCPQNPAHHPEGDVWVHSLLAADAAAEIRDFIPEHQREAFCFAVFLHDIGKPSTTITDRMVAEEHPMVEERVWIMGSLDKALYSAVGHDREGQDPAEVFLRRMTESKKMIKLVRGIVALHMQPWQLSSGNAKKGAYARLSRKMKKAGGDLALIGRMCQCDACATSPQWGTRSLASGDPNWEHTSSQLILNYAEEFEKDDSAVEPKVLGRDLIALGMKPGPEFGKLLKTALDIQYGDSTLSKDEILAQLIA